MQNKNYSPISPIPKEFWKDEDWAYDNYDELVRMYPDQWIAVVNKKVVAAGKNASEVVDLAERKTERKEFPVIFMEKTVRVY